MGYFSNEYPPLWVIRVIREGVEEDQKQRVLEQGQSLKTVPDQEGG